MTTPTQELMNFVLCQLLIDQTNGLRWCDQSLQKIPHP